MLLLSAPNIAGNEWKYVQECLDTGWVSSVGSYVTRFENVLAEFSSCKYAVATSNGTTALHIALLLAGVKEKDYVIAPNVTFVASINAIKYTGADPVLLDVDAQTWQMDLDLLEEFLEKETDRRNGELFYIKDGRTIRCVMPVHVLGNLCDMDRLKELAQRFHLVMVEDAAESLGTYYKGRHTGGFGLLGCFSFNGNKIITTGGGGAIVTDNEELQKKAKHLTTQAKCDPFEYIHDEVGYNYRLVNVLAAMGVAQMELLPSFIQQKKRIDAFYRRELSGTGDIRFQKIERHADCNCWLFTFMTSKQKEVLRVLNDNHMQARPLWVPMNQLKMLKDDIYYTRDDRSRFIHEHCLSIPCSTNIKDVEMEAVVEKIKSVY